MDSPKGGSAPEVADALKPRWEALSQEDRSRLAFRWIDRTVREALPILFARRGRPDWAGLLRSLPPILDVGTVVRAESTLALLERGCRSAEAQNVALQDLAEQAGDDEASLGLLTALFFLRNDIPHVWRSCFLLVMTSRIVFGDDRLVRTMEDDLARCTR